jgi:hypothetical protein
MKTITVLVAAFLLIAAAGWAEAGGPGLFAVGVEFGAPYKLAGSLRYDLPLFALESDETGFGLQPIVSAGMGGAKAGVGILIHGDAGLFSARAVASRTFDHPLGFAPRRDWVGAEVEWSFVHLVSAQAGVLKHPGDGDVAFTWAVGIGLPLIDLDDLPCPGCH